MVFYMGTIPPRRRQIRTGYVNIHTNVVTWHQEEDDEIDHCFRLEALEKQKELEDAVE